MHGHLSQIEWGPAYLAVGVTSARDMGGETMFLTAFRDAVASGQGIGPQLFLAGLVDGGGDGGFGTTIATTPDEGRAVVDAFHGRGFDQMKLYSLLEPEVVDAITRRAHELGMTVTGHVPRSLGLARAVAAGMDEVAHMPIGGNSSPEEIERSIDLLARHKTVVDPTLPWGELLGRARETPIEDFEPGITDVSAPLVLSYRSVRNESDATTVRRGLEATLSLVKRLHDAGVPIVAGTDGAVPGYSLLRSIELFVEAGLTPMEALQTATTVPARALGVEDEVGTVEVGKRADLVVLEDNPLDDISAIRTSRWVVAAGRMYDTAKLSTKM